MLGLMRKSTNICLYYTLGYSSGYAQLEFSIQSLKYYNKDTTNLL